MTTGEFALSVQIAALMTALHRQGVLPIQAVIQEVEATRPFSHDPGLNFAISHLREIADALGPFERQL